MVKKSKKTTQKENFYLSIISELKKKNNLTKISCNLNISKQQLNYYLRELKKKGFVYNKGYGWWELTQKSKNPTEYGIFLKKDFIRGHANVWKIELPQNIKDWEKRIEIAKSKKINHKLIGTFKNILRIKALGRKVWLCKDSIRIFDIEKASYYGETAIESRKNATLQFLRIVNVIENKLGFCIKPFEWNFKKEHYALIKNDLAIDQNRKGIIMRISDETGEWLLIDDSLEKGGELETVGKKAFQTNIPLQNWWNDNKKHNFEVTPTFVLNSMNGIQQNQQIFAQNMESHIGAIKQLGNSANANALTVELLAEKVSELTNAINELKFRK